MKPYYSYYFNVIKVVKNRKVMLKFPTKNNNIPVVFLLKGNGHAQRLCGFTTLNAALIEIHVNFLKLMGRSDLFSPSPASSVKWHDKTWFSKTDPIYVCYPNTFELQSLSCINVRTAHFNPLYPCEIISYIWYPAERKQCVLIKYSQNYNLFVFFL